MSMNFTKLASSITESTIWRESDQTRLTWITMLAMADRFGRVWASIPGLADRARVPVEACREAIAAFSAPDPDSRSRECEGRRIRAIDGGWQLINHEKYRNMRDDDARRAYKAEWMREHRKQPESSVHSPVDTVDTCGLRVDTKQKQKQKQKQEKEVTHTDTRAKEIFLAYPRPAGEEAALKAIRSAVERLVEHGDFVDQDAAMQFLLAKTIEFARSPAGQSSGSDIDFRPHPSKWFNSGNYFDNPCEWAQLNGERMGADPGRFEDEDQTAATSAGGCERPDINEGVVVEGELDERCPF
jgi:hypothetical protein